MKSAGSHCGCEEEDDKKNNNTFSSVSAFKHRGRERVHRSTLAPPVFVSHTAVCSWTHLCVRVVASIYAHPQPRWSQSLPVILLCSY